MAGSVSALLLGALTTTANATQPNSETDAFEIGNHAMGSQIAKVEGDDSSPSTAAAMRPQGVGADGMKAQATVAGIDVASHQSNVDWDYWWGQGKRFAYVKATEATSYTNPYFAQQYIGSYDIGMIRGAYHFAVPNSSSGRAQANYFVDNGGGWSGDGKTLPGALDMEYNPYGSDPCYGMNQAQMGSWIRDFHDTYRSRTGRSPVIYTSTSWWNKCVGWAQTFGDTVPLWVARYSDSVGRLPNGWGYHTFWQYTSSPLDQNSFNGTYDRLQALANG
ncbi:lysozyme [Prauserella halophila]|uniref:Lysozyme n=1 Tax=Prauserella halophila TaxID=185641 RepID=A0ABN1W9I8_9PSEU